MKISVVTISFNQAAYLQRCMDSVVGQDYPDIEYIVVDPGSTDGSRNIISSYGDRVVKVFERDKGAADGLNKGFAHATGDILCFLNSDDEFLPGALRAVADAFQRRPRLDVISGCGFFVDAQGRYLKPIIPSNLNARRYVLGAVTVFQQGTFFRHNYFERVGGFNTDNQTCWDGELFLDMALAGAQFGTIGRDLALFRLHDASITGSGRLNERYAQDCERLFKKVFGRPRLAGDGARSVLAKISKWCLEPTWLLRRLAPRGLPEQFLK